MGLLLNLYLGHLIGDFILQPGRLVIAKRRALAGLLIHVSIIGLSTALILWVDLGALWNLVLLAMAAHMGIELITIKARSFESLSGLSVFMIDQGLHVASLVLIVRYASPMMEVEHVRTLGLSLPVPWLALIIGVIGVTFMGSIIVFELINALGPESRRQAILPYNAERITGMFERGLALLLAATAPGLLGIPTPALPAGLLLVAFAPRTIRALGLPPEERAYQMLTAAAGLILCAIALTLVAAVSLTTAG